MLWSAGLEAPRQVWVHGWLLAAGGERMSKSRGNFLDPNDFVAAFGQDGARYVALREVPFDRDAEVSWDSFVRRYNADLANDFGNLVNRTVSMTNRYLAGERPGSDRRRLAARRLGGRRCRRYRTRHRAPACSTTRWPRCGSFVGAANRLVDAEKPWELAKLAKAGDADAASATARRPGRPARSLPAARPGRRAVPAGDRAAGAGPARLRLSVCRRRQRRAADPGAARVGERAGTDGRVTAPEPLFPRLDTESEAPQRTGTRPQVRLAPASTPSIARLRRRRYHPGVRLIDSHCHLNADRFDGDVDLVVGGARLAGVERILVPGWNVASSAARARRRRSLPVARRRRRRAPARRGEGRRRRLGRRSSGWASDPRVVAIGETGLDFDRVFSPIPDQLANLRRNLRLALDTGKPAILHCRSADGARDAQDALVDELRAAGVGGPAWAAAFGDRPPAIIHSYSGPADYARIVVDLGLAISFSGLVFRRGEEAAADRGGDRVRGSAPGRDGLAVPVAAGCAAQAQRAGMGRDHGALAGRATRRDGGVTRSGPRGVIRPNLAEPTEAVVSRTPRSRGSSSGGARARVSRPARSTPTVGRLASPGGRSRRASTRARRDARRRPAMRRPRRRRRCPRRPPSPRPPARSPGRPGCCRPIAWSTSPSRRRRPTTC